jgi:hypothetical protein
VAAVATPDDEGAIAGLLAKLDAARPSLPATYRLAPIQAGGQH